MGYRREYVRLEEVGGELAQIGVPNADVVLLSDLQQGVLDAFVEFPDFRSGLTQIPRNVWHEMDLAGGRSLPARRRHGPWDQFRFTVNDFYFNEDESLRQATLAVARRDVNSMPPEYRQHLEEQQLLVADMTEESWSVLISWCGASWRSLSDLDGSTALRPMIKAHHVNAYLESVKRDRASAGRIYGEKHPGGRPESPHWPAIYQAIIKNLARRSCTLRSGDVQKLGQHIYTNLKKTVVEGKSPLPNADTIAQRIRRIVHADDNDELSAE